MKKYLSYLRNALILCTLSVCFIAANLGWIPDAQFKTPSSFRIVSDSQAPTGQMVIREALMVDPQAQPYGPQVQAPTPPSQKAGIAAAPGAKERRAPARALKLPRQSM